LNGHGSFLNQGPTEDYFAMPPDFIHGDETKREFK
jgi:hypothetical protein